MNILSTFISALFFLSPVTDDSLTTEAANFTTTTSENASVETSNEPDGNGWQ
ncbi:hypothetical protein ACFW4K_10125 [Nocardiopsis alba]|uniref:hypothetical protein n=1 Tax=Nocardiopsis alba TaxID=53437 RepID=UPI00366C8018